MKYFRILLLLVTCSLFFAISLHDTYSNKIDNIFLQRAYADSFETGFIDLTDYFDQRVKKGSGLYLVVIYSEGDAGYNLIDTANIFKKIIWDNMDVYSVNMSNLTEGEQKSIVINHLDNKNKLPAYVFYYYGKKQMVACQGNFTDNQIKPIARRLKKIFIKNGFIE